MRDLEFKGNVIYDKVIFLVKIGLENDEKGYKREFIWFVEIVKSFWDCGSFLWYLYFKVLFFIVWILGYCL